MTAANHADLDSVPPAGSEALPNGTSLLGEQFTIERQLASGGFGITYLARDNFLSRRVVIKECYPEVFCRREGKKVLVRSSTHQEKYRAIVKMFMREARSIATLRHPNIVGVHRIFEDNDTAYMVLEFEDGQSLRQWLDDLERPATQAELDGIVTPLLDALAEMHAADFIHRDIAPDNIRIRHDLPAPL